MKQVNLYEAKTQLSALVEAAADGEEIIIAKNGKARARLVACEAPAASPRRFGVWADQYGYRAPDAFPETSPAEQALWEVGSIFPNQA